MWDLFVFSVRRGASKVWINVHLHTKQYFVHVQCSWSVARPGCTHGPAATPAERLEMPRRMEAKLEVGSA